MKNIFLSLNDLNRKISPLPLLLFKYALATLSLYQGLIWLIEYKVVFTSEGVLPDLIVNYYQALGTFAFDHVAIVVIFMQIAFALLALLNGRFQNFAFLGLFLVETWLKKRNFIFVNAGDSLLSVLCLFSALTPALTLNSLKRTRVNLADLFPIYILCTVIYTENLYFKFQSRWAQGRGLQDTLAHTELLRGTYSLQLNSTGLLILNYAAILIILLSAITPFINLHHKKIRNGLILLNLLYHLGANLIMHLSWLSLPFIALQGLLFTRFIGKNTDSELSIHFSWRFYVGIFLCLVGFWGIKKSDEMRPFAEQSGFLYTHNWNMFAPPPPSTGRWEAAVTTKDGQTILSESELKKVAKLYDFQHEYKYFYNLRRSESGPLRRQFALLICRQFGEHYSDVELHYYVRFFENGKDLRFIYSRFSCSSENGL